MMLDGESLFLRIMILLYQNVSHKLNTRIKLLHRLDDHILQQRIIITPSQSSFSTYTLEGRIIWFSEAISLSTSIHRGGIIKFYSFKWSGAEGNVNKGFSLKWKNKEFMSAEKGENGNKKIPLKCHKLKNQRSHPAKYHKGSFILSPVISIDNFFIL